MPTSGVPDDVQARLDKARESTEEGHVLGTRVPDTAIHRASFWLEKMKFGERRRDAGVEVQEAAIYDRFIEATGIKVTPDELMEACRYYATNNARMLAPAAALSVSVQHPAGEEHGFVTILELFLSVWMDGFMHGAATTAGLTGRSNSEEDEQAVQGG